MNSNIVTYVPLVMLILVMLVLLATFNSLCGCSYQLLPNYWPCRVRADERRPSRLEIYCDREGADQPALIQQAFRRNAPNPSFTTIYVRDVGGSLLDDIADDLSASYGSVTLVQILDSPSSNLPKILSEFTALKTLMVTSSGINITALGSLHCPSLQYFGVENSNFDLVKGYSLPRDMPMIEVHLTNIFNMNKLEEVTWKRFLEQATQRSYSSSLPKPEYLYLKNGVLKCDCGLSWLVRDQRHLLEFTQVECESYQGYIQKLQDLDPNDFKNCRSH